MSCEDNRAQNQSLPPISDYGLSDAVNEFDNYVSQDGYFAYLQ